MRIVLFLVAPILVAGFDLGPIVRIGQCRSECLRKHSDNGNCDFILDCDKCWHKCEELENTEDARAICQGDRYLRIPALETACTYHNARTADKYEPSMLPAPNKGPVSLDPYDVAVAMYKVDQQWKENGFYPGNRAPLLGPYNWIIVITKNGLRHYSGQEWTPTLESLKHGPLFEATISWRNMRQQLQQRLQRDEQERNNSKNQRRRLFLNEYSEKVLAEGRDKNSQRISGDIIRRIFYERQDRGDNANKLIRTYDASSFANNGIVHFDGTDENEQFSKKRSFVVSWVPETGGLTGNQVTDSESAQISLLPCTKYLVRIATDDGPGSFPIVVDTRPTHDFIYSCFPSSPSSPSPSSSPSVSTYPYTEKVGSWRRWTVFQITIVVNMTCALIIALGFAYRRVSVCNKAKVTVEKV